MPRIGDTVVYTVPVAHETKTVRGGVALQGSVYHPERRVFAGIVGHVYENGSADIELKIPNKPAKWVDAVAQGDGPGEFQLAGGSAAAASVAALQEKWEAHEATVATAAANAATALETAQKAMAAVAKPAA